MKRYVQRSASKSGHTPAKRCAPGRAATPDSRRRLPDRDKLRPALILLFGLSTLAVFGAPNSQTPVYEIGEVRPGRRTVYQIAIPALLPEAGSQQLQPGALSAVIYNDLKASGYFEPVRGQQYVEEQHRLDLQRQQIDHGEWRRLKADFLARGTYQVSGGQLGARVELWESAKGVRVFGREYANYSPAQWRVLAHKISDDIYYYITSKRGVGNTLIAFVHGDASPQGRGVKEIFVMDADGANPRRLTNDRSLTATPCWGKNAAEIYYTSYRDFNPDLCLVPLAGGDSAFISRRPGFNLSPSWDPVRERIALTLGKDGNSEIYSMDRSGKNLKRLTMTRAIDSSPSWFPNGRQLLFTSDRTGSPQIYMMDADGVNPQRLTFEGSYNDSAVLSPRGDRIAYTGRTGGVFNIFVMGVNGRNRVQLTGMRGNQGNNEDPSWSPNGEQLVFSSNRGGSPQIYIMNADGGNVTQLTASGVNHSPAWSPFLYDNP